MQTTQYVVQTTPFNTAIAPFYTDETIPYTVQCSQLNELRVKAASCTVPPFNAMQGNLMH